MDFQTTIKHWENLANQNQGVIAIILFLVAMVFSWIFGFFKWIFNKFKKNNTSSKNVKVGTKTKHKTFNQKSGNNSHNIQGENININNYNNDNKK